MRAPAPAAQHQSSQQLLAGCRRCRRRCMLPRPMRLAAWLVAAAVAVAVSCPGATLVGGGRRAEFTDRTSTAASAVVTGC